MSDSSDEDSRLDEEIQQSFENLEGLRKRRRLLELETQVAEERKRLREAEVRLHDALQGVGPNASGSASCQPPVAFGSSVVPISPAYSQDIDSATDALIQSFANSSNDYTTPIKSDTVENNQISTNNITPPSGQMPGNYERVPSEAGLPAAHQLYIPAPETGYHSPDQAWMIHQNEKQESLALVVWGNEALSRPSPSECPGWTHRKEENHEEKKQPFDANSHNPDNTADINPSQPQRITHPALPSASIQPSPASRIPATPPYPRGLVFGSYQGRKWSECVHYINTLEAHFAEYPDYYTEARAVELGAEYISPALKTTSHDQLMKSGDMSWMSFCTFLAQQLSRDSNLRQAHDGIANASQKYAQPVTHFALWLIQWAPVDPEVSSKKFMETLLRGVLPGIRSGARKTCEQFSDYMSYAMYLQEVENSTPSRMGFIANWKKRIFSPDKLRHKPQRNLLSGPPTQPARRFEKLPPKGPRRSSARSDPYQLPRSGGRPALRRTALCRRGRYPR
ncbi:hypothetical protein N7522_006440 [Penicillium canescens]|nr:hypothetical protein N7522_006440 [Penicillium canescens]